MNARPTRTTPRAARVAPALLATAALLLTACAPGEVDLPDVRGEPVPAAIRSLEEAGFEVDLRGVESDDDSAEAWTVRSQMPVSARAARGEVIRLRATSALENARDACGAGEVADGDRTLLLDMRGEDAFSGDLAYPDIECVLDELGAPQSVLTKMSATRSLDGRQSDDWNGIEASWNYHPDDGLDVILELE